MTTLDVYNELQFFNLKELETIRTIVNFEIAKRKAQTIKDKLEQKQSKNNQLNHIHIIQENPV